MQRCQAPLHIGHVSRRGLRRTPQGRCDYLRGVTDFVNDPVDVAGMPVLDDDAFEPIDPNYLRIAMIGNATAAVIVAVLGIVVTVLVTSNAWIPVAVALAILALIAVDALGTVIEVRHIAYQVREHDISYRNGVFVRTTATVPFARVQHARIRQGPIQRHFGLATVEINSAGPDLRIKGLGADRAERVKALVVERAGELIDES